MNWEALYKTLSAVIGAVFGWLFGRWDPLSQILVAFVVFDYLSGMLASSKEGELSSKVGFQGIKKKVMIFILVAAGHLVDRIIGKDSMVQDAVTVFYISNEFLSLIENAGRVGLPVPKQLKDAVKILKGRAK